MDPTGWPRSLRATHRFSAFVVALLWCATPILAALHASAEAHRYCAEHGAVEEGPEGDAVEAPDAPGPDVAAAFGEGGAAESHDGCAFSRFCRFGQLLHQLVLEASGDVAATVIAAPALCVPAPSVAVIVLAPKTSPPV
jgi:hypothetical protein